MSQKKNGNIFDLPQKALASEKEWIETLLDKAGARLERIVSTGQASPPDFWYDQEEDEWVVLIQGTAELTYADGRVLPLRPGDWVWIPAHERHRVTRTSTSPPCVWLAIFFTD